jgi:aryl-alcohol dehydrogenase-like predicted oxidoreductase
MITVRSNQRKLQIKVESIDLFYQHRVDPNVPIAAVAGLVKEPIELKNSWQI